MSLLAVAGEVWDLLTFAIMGYVLRALADIRETSHGIAGVHCLRSS